MPRRSSRPAPASPEAPAAAPKRRASARLSVSQGEVKRIKSNADLSVKSTSKKSKYFEPESSAESEDNESDGDSGSAYEEPDPEEDQEVSDHQSELEEASESEEEPKAVKGKQGKARIATSDADALKGKELWREGVRTGLGPGKEVFIRKPKARDAGNVAYEDETLHPNTKLFLQDLAENNEREWLKGKAHCEPAVNRS
jgi:hypothetical protein